MAKALINNDDEKFMSELLNFDINPEEILAIASMIAYQGFDSKNLYKCVIVKAEKAKLSSQQRASMIRKTVAIGLLNGNITRDQLDRKSAAEKAVIEEVIKLWNLVVRKNRSTEAVVTNSSLTFTRFISLFPHVASNQLIKYETKFSGNLPGDDIRRFPVQSRKLPVAMRHSGFAALIPNDVNLVLENYVTLLSLCHSGYMVEFWRVKNPAKNEAFAIGVDKQENIVKAARKGLFLTDDEKVSYLVGFGLAHRDSIALMVEVANGVRTQQGKTADFKVEMFTYDADNLAQVIADGDVMKKVITDAAKIST